MSKDLVYESMEKLAEQGVDLSDAVYASFFDASPESKVLLEHVDPQSKGKMMDEIIRLLLTTDYEDEAGYLNWEVDNHEVAYSVKPEMYEPFFGALLEAVEQAMGNEWSDELAAAWVQRTANLREEFIRRFGKG